MRKLVATIVGSRRVCSVERDLDRYAIMDGLALSRSRPDRERRGNVDARASLRESPGGVLPGREYDGRDDQRGLSDCGKTGRGTNVSIAMLQPLSFHCSLNFTVRWSLGPVRR